MVFLFSTCVFAEYIPENLPNVTGYSTNTQIKASAGKIYRIEFVATSASGSFTIYNIVYAAATGSSQFAEANAKAEGSAATARNGYVLDYSQQPLLLTTGIYLYIQGANVIISWE